MARPTDVDVLFIGSGAAGLAARDGGGASVLVAEVGSGNPYANRATFGRIAGTSAAGDAALVTV